jgi:long-chain fatty acid transport protein
LTYPECAAVLLLIPSLSFGAGFALFEAGARSWAMGGAFAAVADDPSAMFWNAAGLAFQIDKGYQIMAGAILIVPEQDFTGHDPFPGDGYFVSQEDQLFFPPHFYFVAPLDDRTAFGISVQSPFGLGTFWPDDFSGRFISKRVELETIEISPNLAFKLSDRFAFGLGVDYRITVTDLTRNVGLVDPFAQQVVDVAQAHIFTDGFSNDCWAWHAGILAKLGGGFALGISYRSDTHVDIEAEASFVQFATGNPMLDGLVGTIIPFDENIPVGVRVEYPDLWMVGLAWSNERLTVSGQYGLMGWAVFQELALVFPENPELNETLEGNFEDSDRYGLGLEYRASPRWAFQLGIEYDNTPQPREAMSPLLGDGDRDVYSVGVSWKAKTFWLDVAYQYITIDGRSTNGESFVGFEGVYESSANLFAASFGWMF